MEFDDEISSAEFIRRLGVFDWRVMFLHDRKILIGTAGTLPSKVTKFFSSAGTLPPRKTAVLPVANRYSPFAAFPTCRFTNIFS